MSSDPEAAPKVWHGRFYEDFEPGDVFPSRFGRTVTEQDNLLFTGLTHNTNSIHFDRTTPSAHSSGRSSSTAPSRSR